MFQEPRPQLLYMTALTRLVGQAQHDIVSDPHLADLKRSTEAPLPPINRKKGRNVPFFLQALITGGTVVMVPLLLGLGVTAKYALPYVRRQL
jgi:hypothetical protein